MKEEVIELEGIVVDCLPGAVFKVRTGNDHMVTAVISGKMRQNKIRIMLSDEVKVAVSPYDLTRGRIIYRNK